MLKKCRKRVPRKRATSMMIVAFTQALSPSFTLSSIVMRTVRDKKRGTVLNGLTIGKIDPT
jgi:hypothetical protein